MRVFIDFVDDPSLAFRYTFELNPGSAGLVNEIDVVDGVVKSFILQSVEEWNPLTDDANDLSSVKTLNLTIGKNPPNLEVFNLYNASIVMICNNNANLTDFHLNIQIDGTVYFGLDEDTIIDSGGRFDCLIDCEILYAVVDLPDGVNGIVDWGTPPSNIYLEERVGWFREISSYETPETTRPLVDISVRGQQDMYLWLYD